MTKVHTFPTIATLHKETQLYTQRRSNAESPLAQKFTLEKLWNFLQSEFGAGTGGGSFNGYFFKLVTAVHGANNIDLEENKGVIVLVDAGGLGLGDTAILDFQNMPTTDPTNSNDSAIITVHWINSGPAPNYNWQADGSPLVVKYADGASTFSSFKVDGPAVINLYQVSDGASNYWISDYGLEEVGSIYRTPINDTDHTVIPSESDQVIAITALSAPRTMTLPPPGTQGDYFILFKDEAGQAGTHTITIEPDGSETIDGAASQLINSNYGSVRVYTDGTDWFTA